MAAGLFQQLYGKQVYVASAGVQKGELDPFVVAVMDEIGIDIARHKPTTFEELDELDRRLLLRRCRKQKLFQPFNLLLRPVQFPSQIP